MILSVIQCNICKLEQPMDWFKGKGLTYGNGRFNLCSVFEEKISIHICDDCMLKLSDLFGPKEDDFKSQPLEAIGSEP